MKWVLVVLLILAICEMVRLHIDKRYLDTIMELSDEYDIAPSIVSEIANASKDVKEMREHLEHIRENADKTINKIGFDIYS